MLTFDNSQCILIIEARNTRQSGARSGSPVQRRKPSGQYKGRSPAEMFFLCLQGRNLSQTVVTFYFSERVIPMGCLEVQPL